MNDLERRLSEIFNRLSTEYSRQERKHGRGQIHAVFSSEPLTLKVIKKQE